MLAGLGARVGDTRVAQPALSFQQAGELCKRHLVQADTQRGPLYTRAQPHAHIDRRTDTPHESCGTLERGHVRVGADGVERGVPDVAAQWQ